MGIFFYFNVYTPADVNKMIAGKIYTIDPESLSGAKAVACSKFIDKISGYNMWVERASIIDKLCPDEYALNTLRGYMTRIQQQCHPSNHSSVGLNFRLADDGVSVEVMYKAV